MLAHAREVVTRGQPTHAEWQKTYDAWRAANPERAALLDRVASAPAARGPGRGAAGLPRRRQGRGHPRRVRQGPHRARRHVMPELWGGSADLAESNNTTMEGVASFVPTNRQTSEWTGGPYGRTLHFGIREHAMGMILNGIALEGLTRPYGGTFLVFSDYMRPVGPARRPPAAAGHLRLDARLDRSRRGRPDPPADRAPGRAARHPGPGRRPPGRRQRDRRRVAHDPRPHRPPGRPGPDPPGRCRSSTARQFAVGRGRRQGRLRPRRRQRRQPAGHPRRPPAPRSASPSAAREQLEAAGRADPRRVDALPRVVRRPGPVLPRRGAPARRAGPRQHRGRASPFGWHDIVGDAGRVIGIDHYGASADYQTLYQRVRAHARGGRGGRATNPSRQQEVSEHEHPERPT